ncbi:MAG: response regulator [Spirochaetes bacterium]|nr:response regulator [Spirochaetota bacterium]
MNKQKILIVEDEVIISLSIQLKLSSMGYQVIKSVRSGEEAVETISKSKPNIIIMDIILEGKMDGIEAAKVINQKYHIPVIFMTGNSDPLTISRAKKIKPAGILIKPIMDEDLKKTLKQAATL